MSSIPELYERLTEPIGKKITVRTGDKKIADSIRVALIRKNSLYKDLDMVAESVCMDFDAASGTATYWLGLPRKKRGASWEIVEDSHDD